MAKKTVVETSHSGNPLGLFSIAQKAESGISWPAETKRKQKIWVKRGNKLLCLEMYKVRWLQSTAYKF